MASQASRLPPSGPKGSKPEIGSGPRFIEIARAASSLAPLVTIVVAAMTGLGFLVVHLLQVEAQLQQVHAEVKTLSGNLDLIRPFALLGVKYDEDGASGLVGQAGVISVELDGQTTACGKNYDSRSLGVAISRSRASTYPCGTVLRIEILPGASGSTGGIQLAVLDIFDDSSAAPRRIINLTQGAAERFGYGLDAGRGVLDVFVKRVASPGTTKVP